MTKRHSPKWWGLALWLEYSTLPRYPKWMGSGWHNHHSWQSRCLPIWKLDPRYILRLRGAPKMAGKQTGAITQWFWVFANLSPNASEEGPICRRGIINHSGQTRSSRQFGNIHQGQVTVSKFEDLNTNGVWDEDESLLADWEMKSSKQKVVLLRRQQTDTGSTTFLLVGTYNLSETEQKVGSQSGIYCDNQEVLVDRLQEQAQQIGKKQQFVCNRQPWRPDLLLRWQLPTRHNWWRQVLWYQSKWHLWWGRTTLPEWQITYLKRS